MILYGTSEKLLDINRGINKVRGIMIPESSKLQPKDEFIRYRKKDCFMIPHDSFLAKAWSFILINLLLYTATVMPFKIALIED